MLKTFCLKAKAAITGNYKQKSGIRYHWPNKIFIEYSTLKNIKVNFLTSFNFFKIHENVSLLPQPWKKSLFSSFFYPLFLRFYLVATNTMVSVLYYIHYIHYMHYISPCPVLSCLLWSCPIHVLTQYVMSVRRSHIQFSIWILINNV